VQETGSRKEQKPLRRSGVVILGWIFMLAGAAGLLLPIVPGAFLIFVGALMLGCRCTWLRQLREKCRARFPALERAVQWLSAKSGSWQNRFTNNPGNSESRFRVCMARGDLEVSAGEVKDAARNITICQ
jgi:hypothetical protein